MCFVFWAFTPCPSAQNPKRKILFAIIINETVTRGNIKKDKKFTSYNSRHTVTLLVPRRSTHICYANIAYRHTLYEITKHFMNIVEKNLQLGFEKSYFGKLRKAFGNDKIILPAVRAATVDEDGKFLFVKRKDDNKWVMPAGAVELGESAEQAIIREIYEETGLIAISPEATAIYSDPKYDFTNPFGGKHQMFAMVFLIRQWKGNLEQKTEETNGCRFFSTNELPDTLDVYKETIDDISNYTGKFILK